MTYPIVVTGANSQIGASIVEHLLSLDYVVVALYHTDADRIGRFSNNPNCSIYKADVTSFQQLEDINNSLISEYQAIGGVVLVASYQSSELWNIDPQLISLEKWNQVLEVDLTGTWLCLKAFTNALLASPDASVITFSGSSAVSADPDTFAYNPAKAGVIALTRSYAKYYAGKIRANILLPGSIDSGWIEKWKLKKHEVAKLKAVQQGLKRLGEPNEVAKTVAFLLSNDSSYVNGQTIFLDGGYTP